MKAFEHPLEVGLRTRAALGHQRPLDHAPRAAADELAGGLVRHRRQALAAQDQVERLDEVGRGVDQRAVKVEDDGQHGVSPRRRLPAAQAPEAR